MAEVIEEQEYLWYYAPPHHDKVYLSQVVREEGKWHHVTAYARRGQPLNTRRRTYTHASLASRAHGQIIAEKQAKGYQVATAQEVLLDAADRGPAPTVSVVVKPPEPAFSPPPATSGQRKIFDLDDE